MSNLDKIGKAILRKERILNYQKKRDTVSKIDEEHLNTPNETIFLLHWWIKGDEIADLKEFIEFLESSFYNIKFYKYESRVDEIQCTMEITNKILTKDYYYKLYGFLMYHSRDFFCEIFGINTMPLGGDAGWEPLIVEL